MEQNLPHPIPSELLDAPITGSRLGGESLRQALGDGTTLLAFLRHFG